MRVIPDAVKRIWNIYFFEGRYGDSASASASHAATVSPIPSGIGSSRPT